MTECCECKKSETGRNDLKVLVVEDNDVSREVLRLVLKDKHKIFTAKGEEEGWRLYKEKKPDIVFMDIRIADGDGLSLTRRIKEDDPKSYVVIMTVSDFDEEKEKAAENRADGFIAKPFTKAEIEDFIERYWILKVRGGQF